MLRLSPLRLAPLLAVALLLVAWPAWADTVVLDPGVGRYDVDQQMELLEDPSASLTSLKRFVAVDEAERRAR